MPFVTTATGLSLATIFGLNYARSKSAPALASAIGGLQEIRSC